MCFLGRKINSLSWVIWEKMDLDQETVLGIWEVMMRVGKGWGWRAGSELLPLLIECRHTEALCDDSCFLGRWSCVLAQRDWRH